MKIKIIRFASAAFGLLTATLVTNLWASWPTVRAYAQDSATAAFQYTINDPFKFVEVLVALVVFVVPLYMLYSLAHMCD